MNKKSASDSHDYDEYTFIPSKETRKAREAEYMKGVRKAGIFSLTVLLILVALCIIIFPLLPQ